MQSVAEKNLAFAGVEQLEEAASGLGWDIDYHKLDAGSFNGGLVGVADGGLTLVWEGRNNHLHVRVQPPEGKFGLFLLRLHRGSAWCAGQQLKDGDIAVLPSGSEMSFVTHGEPEIFTVFVAEDEFRAAAHALGASIELGTGGDGGILRGGVQQLAAIQREIEIFIRTGNLDPESASRLLGETILRMEAARGKRDPGKQTGGSQAVTARLARAYIDEHFRESVRLKEVCAAAGVSLRTLQRSFAAHLQVSPLQYLKVRRLNQARRELLAADPAGDSVTRIALANGLAHIGRFAVDYRTLFGESPSKTLGRQTPVCPSR